MTPDQLSTAITCAVVYCALYSAHQVGDHWVQTDREALGKGGTGWSGRLACLSHVATLTATKLGFVVLAWLVLGLSISPAGLAVGLGVDAVSHYWADRRTTLARLARLVGKGPWFEHDPQAPYLLDQSWHVGWLLPAALLVATV